MFHHHKAFKASERKEGMRARFLLFVLLFLAFISFSFSACVNLSDSNTWGTAVTKSGDTYYIHENVTLCYDDYNLADTSNSNPVIVINADDLTFDCNGSTINGSGSTSSYPQGIGWESATHSNILIKNCDVINYQRAFRFDGGSNITVKDSSVGDLSNTGAIVYLSNSIDLTLDSVSASHLSITGAIYSSNLQSGSNISILNSDFEDINDSSNKFIDFVPNSGTYRIYCENSTFSTTYSGEWFLRGPWIATINHSTYRGYYYAFESWGNLNINNSYLYDGYRPLYITGGTFSIENTLFSGEGDVNTHQTAIYLTSSANNGLIKDNIGKNYSYGIYFDGASNNSINNNFFCRDVGAAYYLDNSAQNNTGSGNYGSIGGSAASSNPDFHSSACPSCIDLYDNSTWGSAITQDDFGTYYVNGNVTLCRWDYKIGASASESTHAALIFNASNANLDCFGSTIEPPNNDPHYEWAIKAEDLSNITVTRCKVMDFYLGSFRGSAIDFRNISGCTISNSTFYWTREDETYWNEVFVYLEDSAQCQLFNNTFSHAKYIDDLSPHFEFIRIDSSNYVDISRNSFNTCAYHITSWSDNNTVISNNNFTFSSLYCPTEAISLYVGTNLSLENNYINISGNTSGESSAMAIKLVEVKNGSIQDNVIDAYYLGPDVWYLILAYNGLSNISIYNNTVMGHAPNGGTVSLIGLIGDTENESVFSYNISVGENYLSGGYNYFGQVDGLDIYKNIFISAQYNINGYGVYLVKVRKANLTNNLFKNFNYGYYPIPFVIQDTNNSYFEYNSISDSPNLLIGIYFSDLDGSGGLYSVNNTISHNSFCGASSVSYYLSNATENNTGVSNVGNLTDDGVNNSVQASDASCHCVNLSDSSTWGGKLYKNADGQIHITGSVALCKGVYKLNPQINYTTNARIGIHIDHNDAMLDCQGSTLETDLPASEPILTIYIHRANNSVLKNCKIQGYDGDGIYAWGGVQASGAVNTTMDNITMDNTYFGVGVAAGYSINGTFSNLYINRTRSTRGSIYLLSSQNSPQSYGNRYENITINNSNYGISLFPSNSGAVYVASNNTFTSIGIYNTEYSIYTRPGFGTNQTFNSILIENGTYGVYIRLPYSSVSQFTDNRNLHFVNLTILNMSESGLVLNATPDSNINLSGLSIINSSISAGIYSLYISNFVNLTNVTFLNTIFNSSSGTVIYIINSSNLNFRSSHLFTSTGISLCIEGSSLNHYIHNISTDNLINGKPLYYFSNGQTGDGKTNITDSAIGALVVANSSLNLTPSSLTIEPNTTCMGSVFLYTDTNTNISNVKIQNAELAVKAEDSSNIILSNFNLTSNTKGIYLDNSDIKVKDSTLSQNNYSIYLDKAFNITFTNTTLSNDDHSIYLTGNPAGSISGGYFYNDTYALLSNVTSSSSNILLSNATFNDSYIDLYKFSGSLLNMSGLYLNDTYIYLEDISNLHILNSQFHMQGIYSSPNEQKVNVSLDNLSFYNDASSYILLYTKNFLHVNVSNIYVKDKGAYFSDGSNLQIINSTILPLDEDALELSNVNYANLSNISINLSHTQALSGGSWGVMLTHNTSNVNLNNITVRFMDSLGYYSCFFNDFGNSPTDMSYHYNITANNLKCYDFRVFSGYALYNLYNSTFKNIYAYTSENLGSPNGLGFIMVNSNNTIAQNIVVEAEHPLSLLGGVGLTAEYDTATYNVQGITSSNATIRNASVNGAYLCALQGYGVHNGLIDNVTCQNTYYTVGSVEDTQATFNHIYSITPPLLAPIYGLSPDYASGPVISSTVNITDSYFLMPANGQAVKIESTSQTTFNLQNVTFANTSYIELKDWPQAGGNPERLSYAHDSGFTNMTLLWNLSLDNNTGWAAPIIVEGVLYMPSAETLYAINASSGNILWNISTPMVGMTRFPIYIDGKVIIEGHGTVTAFNASSGNILWNISLPTGGIDPVAGDGLYFSASADPDNKVYAVNVSDGSVIWSHDNGDSCTDEVLSYHDGKLFSIVCNNLDILNASTGALIKRITIPTGPIASAPTIYGDRIYVYDWHAYLTVIDLNTLDVLFHAKKGASANGGYTSPIIANGKLVVGDYAGHIFVYNSQTLEPICNFTSSNYVEEYSDPIVVGDIIFAAFKNNDLNKSLLYEINLNNCQEIANYTLSERAYAPISYWNGIVYASPRDNSLFAFKLTPRPAMTTLSLTTNQDIGSNDFKVGTNFVAINDSKSYLNTSIIATLNTLSCPPKIYYKQGMYSNASSIAGFDASSCSACNISCNPYLGTVTFTSPHASSYAAGTLLNTSLLAPTKLNFTNTLPLLNISALFPANCVVQLDAANISAIPTNSTAIYNLPMGIAYTPISGAVYSYLNNYQYYNGAHQLTLWCKNESLLGYEIKTYQLNAFPPVPDRVYYSQGDTLNITLELADPTITNVVANLSALDSNFNAGNVQYEWNGTRVYVLYNISTNNAKPEGQYNVSFALYNANGLAGYLHTLIHYKPKTTWTLTDASRAFRCWSGLAGWYFSEVNCDWSADVVHAFDLSIGSNTETQCFDGVDNDGDGKTDAQDPDCSIYFVIRHQRNISSSTPVIDPCVNNVCRFCLGTDNNGDGYCDYPNQDVQVYYTEYVKPGQKLKVKYYNSGNIAGKSLTMTLKNFPSEFNVTDSSTTNRQLDNKAIGPTGCTQNCQSLVSYEDNYAGSPTYLSELLTVLIPSTVSEGTYSGIEAARDIDGNTMAGGYLTNFQVSNSAIINESDHVEGGIHTWCNDNIDNDLDSLITGDYFFWNDSTDCRDLDCNNTIAATVNGHNVYCQYRHELNCTDGFDNDGDGYTDCQDMDCFGNVAAGCPSDEGAAGAPSTTCFDGINNDYDYGLWKNDSVQISKQELDVGQNWELGPAHYTHPISPSDAIQLIDCRDPDCDGAVSAAGHVCQFGEEINCTDGFDNDGDGYTDCQDYDCRLRYKDGTLANTSNINESRLACPLTEATSPDGTLHNDNTSGYWCADGIDNDLDKFIARTWETYDVNKWIRRNLGQTDNTTGIDCRDPDCDGLVGNSIGLQLCEYGNETSCSDAFDNDADNAMDCADSDCAGKGGACRPCPLYENISDDSCMNNYDDDHDGLIDAQDPDCYGKVVDIYGHIAAQNESNFCNDGFDNDGDGLIDSADPDCPAQYTTEITAYGGCRDGIDNDRDGKTDCADPDCANTFWCITHSNAYPHYRSTTINGILVQWMDFIKNGDNFTAKYSKSGLSNTVLDLYAGTSNYPLGQLNANMNDSNTYMTGTTTTFTKIVSAPNTLKAHSDGFTGNLALNLAMTTNASNGHYTIDLMALPEGGNVNAIYHAPTYLSTDTTPPTIIDTYPHTTVYANSVTLRIEANDTAGIERCAFKLDSNAWQTALNCSYTIANLQTGTHVVQYMVYDNKANIETGSYSFESHRVPEITVNNGTTLLNHNHFNTSQTINFNISAYSENGFSNNTSLTVTFFNENAVAGSVSISCSVNGTNVTCQGTAPVPSAPYYGANLSITDANNISTYKIIEPAFTCSRGVILEYGNELCAATSASCYPAPPEEKKPLPQLSLSIGDVICPDNKVGVDSEPDAKITMKDPNGEAFKEYTNKDGEAYFTLTANGTYSFLAEKDNYESAYKTTRLTLCEILKNETNETLNQTINETINQTANETQPQGNETVEQGGEEGGEEGSDSSSGYITVGGSTAYSISINAPPLGYVDYEVNVYIYTKDGKPLSGAVITAVGPEESYTFKTNDNGRGKYTPRKPGIYIYTSSTNPVLRMSSTKVVVKGAEEQGNATNKTYKATVPLETQETLPIILNPDINGSYTAEIYLDNVLVTTRQGKGELSLVLPKGRYHIVIKSTNEINGVSVQYGEKESLPLDVTNPILITGTVLVVLGLAFVALIIIRGIQRRLEFRR